MSFPLKLTELLRLCLIGTLWLLEWLDGRRWRTVRKGICGSVSRIYTNESGLVMEIILMYCVGYLKSPSHGELPLTYNRVAR